MLVFSPPMLAEATPADQPERGGCVGDEARRSEQGATSFVRRKRQLVVMRWIDGMMARQVAQSLGTNEGRHGADLASECKGS